VKKDRKKEMVTCKVRVLNRTGIHLRLANEIVNAASQFDAMVMLEKDGLEVNAKSMLGVAMLGAEQGAELTLKIEGSDEQKALDTLTGLFETNFGREVI
jgi:phosphocarrier protein HPr